MKMKYFQAVADIKEHYDNVLASCDEGFNGVLLLETWGINKEEKELLSQEREVLRYLIGCQLNIVHEKNVKKPPLETVARCFNRHLTFLESIHNCHTYNVNKHPSKIVQNEYKACRHYLFKFSLPAWYEKLPLEILTFENKYPNHTF